MRDTLINLATVATSSAYAAWLRKHKHAEPDMVWAEVSAGVAYTLLAARLKTPRGAGVWRDGHIYEAFAYAGVPIIVGELAQWIERRAIRKRLAERWQVLAED